MFADPRPPAEPAASAAREAASADRALPPAGAARPSERSASGDLWSGFGFAGRASLVPGANDPAGPVRGTGAQLVVGIGLLGAGLAVLLAGGAVTRSRSRRRRVASGGARRG